MGLLGIDEIIHRDETDTFRVSQNMSVVIECPNRKKMVAGALLRPFEFGAEAEWSGKGMGAILDTAVSGFSKVMEIGESAANALFGASIQQPWLNRPVYKQTTAGPYNLYFELVAFGGTPEEIKAQVVDPVETLLSFCYPIKVETPPALAEVKKLLQDAVNVYTIPGPSILYSNDQQHGNWLEITIGKIAYFKPCYLTSVKGSFDSYHPVSGLPLHASLQIVFKPLDNALVTEEHGVFSREANVDAFGDLGIINKIQSAAEEGFQKIGEQLSQPATPLPGVG